MKKRGVGVFLTGGREVDTPMHTMKHTKKDNTGKG